MPHLSPMNWLTMLIMMWMMTMLIISTLYYYMPSSFNNPLFRTTAMMNITWPWLLQDGRK